MARSFMVPKSDIAIPRKEMPQVPGDLHDNMCKWIAESYGVDIRRGMISVRNLKPSQSEFNDEKIETMIKDGFENKKPILVSADNYIIDGHHTFIAMYNQDPLSKILAIQIAAPIEECLSMLRAFPQTEFRSVHESFAEFHSRPKKSVVLTFGRFSPPTIGHQVLINKMMSVAKEEGIGDVRVYASQSHDSKKNPLSWKSKLRWLKKAFPGVIIMRDPAIKNLYQALQQISDEGYTRVILVVGSDRVDGTEKQVRRYIATPEDNRGYRFEDFAVVSGGDRDPDGDSATGMSASKMRAAARDMNIADFKAGLPNTLSSTDKEDLFYEIRKEMAVA